MILHQTGLLEEVVVTGWVHELFFLEFWLLNPVDLVERKGDSNHPTRKLLDNGRGLEHNNNNKKGNNKNKNERSVSHQDRWRGGSKQQQERIGTSSKTTGKKRTVILSRILGG